ncbi:hypothetical protein AAMO2058_001098400, partial [Amorphochlora amoebiformis]
MRSLREIQPEDKFRGKPVRGGTPERKNKFSRAGTRGSRARQAIAEARALVKESEKKSKKFRNRSLKPKTKQRKYHDGDIQENIIFSQAQTRDFKSVFELSFTRRKIKNIGSALAFARNLRALNLSFNCIEHVLDLSTLTNLRQLKLVGNSIKDITPLLTLKSLKSLSIDQNSIKTLPDLSKLRSLAVLHIRSNNLSSISFQSLPRTLTELDLSDNKLLAVEIGPYAPAMQLLSLARNRIRILPDLSECAKLFFVNVSGNGLSTLMPMGTPPSLSMLNAGQNQLTSLEMIPPLPHVTELFLPDNNIKNLHGISQRYPEIDSLDLEGNNITDVWSAIKALSSLPHLYDLRLLGNDICGSSYRLTVCTKLEKLESLDGEEITHKDRLTTSSNVKRFKRKEKWISNELNKEGVWSGGRPLMTPRSAKDNDKTIVSLSRVEKDLKSTEDSLLAFRTRVNSILTGCDVVIGQMGGTPR